ncbi:MAG: hypothetical protein SF182_09355 [Deltaproteobacteria bacterium]|nr:hypothetical protein [Deltaproteobacteria bacterium]
MTSIRLCRSSLIARRSSLVLALSLMLLAAPASARCPGDCDRDNQVRVHELLAQVGIALGRVAVDACPTVPGDFGDTVEVGELVAAVNGALTGCPSLDFPALTNSYPASDAAVPGTEWLRFAFGAALDARDLPLMEVRCGDSVVPVRTRLLAPGSVLLNPLAPLPAEASCRVSWPGGGLDFHVAPEVERAAQVFWDRGDARRLTPLPDDYYFTEAVEDGPAGAVPSGILTIPLPDGPPDLQQVFSGLVSGTLLLNGFSPLAPWVIELSDPPDPTTVPRSPADSLDPLATVQLFDITPDAETYGQRVPFRLEPRTDASVTDVVTHSLLLWPSIPLQPRHQYGLIITRRARAVGGGAFAPSSAFSECLDEPLPLRAAVHCRDTRRNAMQVLEAAHETAPDLDRDDAALVVRATIRSTAGISNDQVAVRAQMAAATPPAYEITSIEPGSSGQVAAIVRGTWQAPDWRDANNEFVRDAQGKPAQTRSKSVPFTLALPNAALSGRVPVVMYQHGNPGSSEAEVPSAARRSLAAEGFAVIGFTDILNRELSAGITDRDQAILAQVAPVLGGILTRGRVPDFWAETRAEQIAFLRMIDGLGGLDVLPIGAPDGTPELDLGQARGYLGISEGANNGPGILPYAPQIRAAALVAGGARLTEVLIHQSADTFLTSLGALFPSLTPTEIWTGLAMFQMLYDDQDAHNHAPFIYTAPPAIEGPPRKTSVLLLEGLNDSLVPNHATNSLAWSIGLPHLAPVQRAVPFLDVVDGPLQGNLGDDISGAFYQYVPTGIAGIDPTPGCAALPPSSGSEGHYCPQSAAESFRQRAEFFKTALTGTPRIIDPLAAE